MNRSTTIRTAALITTTALALGALTAGTAHARQRDRALISLQGTGPAISSTGSATIQGTASGHVARKFVNRNIVTGTFIATMTATDGTLPTPETCEPATATFTLNAEKRSDLNLTADGTICGHYPQPPLIVTHSFTGRYRVVDAQRHRLEGTDGFLSISIGTTNTGGVDVFDS